MANRNQAEQNELRRLVAEALGRDITDPRDVYCYVMDNGWQFGSPSITTIEKIMKEMGLVYVWGRWEWAK